MSDSVWDDYAFHAKYHSKNQIYLSIENEEDDGDVDVDHCEEEQRNEQDIDVVVLDCSKREKSNKRSSNSSKNNNKKKKKKQKRDHAPAMDLLFSPPSLTNNERAEYFRRTGRLILHELGHNFGLAHCIHHHCYMNGSGNLIEDFATPAIECGLCLRKLQFQLGFSVVDRYEALRKVFEENSMNTEAKWIADRQLWLNSHRAL
jgi:hypothetical protein